MILINGDEMISVGFLMSSKVKLYRKQIRFTSKCIFLIIYVMFFITNKFVSSLLEMLSYYIVDKVS